MSDQAIVLPDFSGASVLVYGDVMLDRYWHGDAKRISPEAPVPVVNVESIEMRPGGAANVAQNISALGSQVTLCGLVGDDEAGRELKAALDSAQVDSCFQVLADYPTITKLRVLGANQQLIRMDFEKARERELNDDSLIAQYAEKLKTAQVVVLSDYSKGALCHVEKIIALAKAHNIPVLVDPKNKDYQRYSGATIVTPNRKEFEMVVGACADLSEIISKARELLSRINIQYLLVTLGKDGMVLVHQDEEALHFPTQAQDVFDVTGAGDTVIATLAAGMAAGMAMSYAVELSNIAAGICVGHLGAQAVSIADLQHALFSQSDCSATLTQDQMALVIAQARSRGERIVMTNGCFDILHVGHVDYLKKAKAMGDRLLIAVNDDDSVRRLKGAARPFNPLSARLSVLAALGVVDWVVPFSEDTPARLIESVMPDVLVKGGDYQIKDIAGSDVILKNGGHVATIPMVPGFSTTRLSEKLKGESA